jgi:hypothetical protein
VVLAASPPGTDWQAVTAWATIVLSVLGIGAVYQLFDNRRSRNTEIVRRLGEHWHSPEIIEGRRLIRKHRTDEELILAFRRARSKAAAKGDEYYTYLRLLDFFEEIGLSHSRRGQGFGRVNKILGGIIISSWGEWRPVIEDVWPSSRSYANFRKIAGRLKRTRKREDVYAAIGRALLRFCRWATSSDYGRYN